MKYILTPGSMYAVRIAIDLFGIENVDPGDFATPVFVEIKQECDYLAAKQLL